MRADRAGSLNFTDNQRCSPASARKNAGGAGASGQYGHLGYADEGRIIPERGQRSQLGKQVGRFLLAALLCRHPVQSYEATCGVGAAKLSGHLFHTDPATQCNPMPPPRLEDLKLPGENRLGSGPRARSFPKCRFQGASEHW